MAGNIKGITIEIGGDTTKLESALSGVNKSTKNIQTELKAVDRLLKFDPKNTEALAQKQKLLAEQVENTKTKLDTLKEAQIQAKQQLAEGKIGEEQYRALAREVEFTAKQLDNLEEELKSTNNKWKEFGDKANEAGEKMKGVGEKMSLGITAPIMAIGAGAMVAFNEVDGALDTIVTKTGATGEAIEALSSSFDNVAGNGPYEIQAVGDAIGEVNTQFGLLGPELEEATELILRFSEINGQDVTSSTISSKQAIEAFGLSAQDLPAVLDAVTKTAQNTGISTDALFDSVIKGAPQLKAMGLEFETSAAVMGRFEQKGIDGGKALSYMAKAQVTFAKDGKTLQEGMGELIETLGTTESETERLTLASEYFGTKGAAFMLDALDQGALSLGDFSNAATDATGSVNETFEGTLDPIDNYKTAMNNLKIVGNDLATSMQEVLAPAMEAIVKALQEFATWFKDLPGPVKETMVVIAGLAAAIGPLLIIFGTIASSITSIITVFGTLGTTFATIGAAVAPLGAAIGAISLPVVAVVAAVGLLIAAGIALYKNWDEVKAFALKTWEDIKSTILGILDKVKADFTKFGTDISTLWTNTWNGVKTFISDTLSNIRIFITTFIQVIKDSWNMFGENLKIVTTAMWDGINNTFSVKIEEAKDLVRRGLDAIVGFFRNLKIPQFKIPLPHFKINGSFSLNPPSVPKLGVDWYDKGGIFTGPTVIGVGEKRPEFVGALDDLRKIVREESNEGQKIENNFNISSLIVREEADIKKIARELYDMQKRTGRGLGMA